MNGIDERLSVQAQFLIILRAVELAEGIQNS